MPQSLSKVYIHYVFSTKNRKPIITNDVQADLHKYIIGIFSNYGSYVNAIYANPDHIHILCTLPRTITIANLISKVKSSSSKWIKTKGISDFSWQRLQRQ
jgi:REP element-mobilizing transposase RayT